MTERARVANRPDRPGLIRRVRVIVREDIRWLDRLPGRRWGALLLAAAAAVAFGTFRQLAYSAPSDGFHPTFVALYTESLVFLLVALAIGALSRTTGVAFVLLFTIFDFVHFVVAPPNYQNTQVTVWTAVGRLVTYVLLWLLVVSIPLLARRVDDAFRSHRRAAVRVAGILGAAAVGGGLVFLWSNAEPYMVRTAFTDIGPSTQAMLPQTIPGQMGLAGGLIVGLGAALSRPFGDRLGDLVRLVDLSGGGPLALAARFMSYVIFLVLMRGLITGWLDLALLGAAFVVGEMAASVTGRSASFAWLRARPVWLRILAGAVAAFLVGQAITLLLGQRNTPTAFFPTVLSLAFAIVIVRAAVADAFAPVRLPTSRLLGIGQAAIPFLSLGIAVGALLLVPGTALADNCLDEGDCSTGFWAQVGAAISAMAAALWALICAIFEKTPPVISELEPLLSPEGAEAELGALEMLRDQVAQEQLLKDDGYEEYQRIKEMSLSDFVDEAMTGKWDSSPSMPRGRIGGSAG